MNVTTSNLAEFGHRERKMAAELLSEWNKGNLPFDFYDQGVTIMMNKNSGYVFLTNEDYQVAMINDESGKLESFYTSPYSGIEGFFSDLKDEYSNMEDEDKKWYNELKKQHKKNKTMNGFSRAVVEPTGMNGFSRMDYQIDGYTLNDYTLNDYTLNAPRMFSKRWFRRNAPASYILTGLGVLVITDIATGGKVREMVGLKKKGKKR